MDKAQLIAALQKALETQDFIQLNELITTAKSSFGEEAFTHYYVGEWELLQENAPAAIAAFQQAIEKENKQEYQVSLAFAYLNDEQQEIAKGLIDDLLTKDPNNPELRLAMALYLATEMDDDGALGQLNQAISSNTDLLEARELRAEILTNLDQPEEALKDLEYLLNKEPQRDDLRFERIELNKALENKAAVEADFQYLIETDPADLGYRLQLGNYYMEIRDYKEAEYAFADVMDLEERLGIHAAQTLQLHSLALLRQGSYYKAIDGFKKAMKLDGEDAENYLYIAESYRQLKEIDKSINYLQIGLDVVAYERYKLYLLLGELSLEQEAWDQAEDAFDGMTRETAGKAEGFFQLGLLYVRQGDLQSAFDAFKKADEEFHPRAEDMIEQYCGDFLQAGARAEEEELMAVYEDDFAKNAESATLKKAFGQLWKMDLKTTQANNELLGKLPEEMSKPLLKAFQHMVLRISPQGLLILNPGKDDTRALYSINEENGDIVDVATQPFGNANTQSIQFKITASHFILAGVGADDAALDLYFVPTSADQLHDAIRKDYQKKEKAGLMAYLGDSLAV